MFSQYISSRPNVQYSVDVSIIYHSSLESISSCLIAKLSPSRQQMVMITHMDMGMHLLRRLFDQPDTYSLSVPPREYYISSLLGSLHANLCYMADPMVLRTRTKSPQIKSATSTRNLPSGLRTSSRTRISNPVRLLPGVKRASPKRQTICRYKSRLLTKSLVTTRGHRASRQKDIENSGKPWS